MRFIRLITFFCFIALVSPVSMAQERPSLITVSAEGSASAAPDQAALYLSFSHESPRVDDARKVVDRQVAKVLKMLESFDLVGGSLDSSQTRIHPQYNYLQGQQSFRAYQVNREVHFVLGNLEQLEALVQKLSENEITRLQRIEPGLSNPGLVKQEALDNAIQESKMLARHIAEQYEVTLGPVHDVRYHAREAHAPRPMAMRAELASNSAPSYEQQELDFKANIEVSFTLK